MHLEYVMTGQQAPMVDAGEDQTIVLGDGAVLAGSVTDDGLPAPPALTSLWAQVSGPGTVVFADPAAVDTSVSFSAVGVYVLRLIGDDGELTSSDETIITVVGTVGEKTLDVQVDSSSDDAEENESGKVSLNSSDLELVLYHGAAQTVGIRFNGLAIPQDATILSAYVQFTVDETSGGGTILNIRGEAADNAGTFVGVSGNISSRPTTTASEVWLPPAWTTVGEAGIDQQTVDIAAVIQEIVSRSGWSIGNSLALIITGSGDRVAASFNGDQAAAPRLHIVFSQG